ncbi:DNA helicase [Paramicrosporidium saccamoebae]|uniref:DNA replication licensing factor MCM5 n=1 Tax=Paramicrosporidium saccamoebae TaxID=1246581 RepID=A0A2H9TIG9_9FUNG|nr:DNA helicase [Paramicrosporidium saccamoebae]
MDLGHIQAFDEHLATQLMRRPAEIIPFFENAARQLALQICVLPEETTGLRNPLGDLQVQLNSSTIPMAVRDLDAQHIGRLVRIPGIIVSASTVTARPTNVCIICRGCRQERFISLSNGIGVSALPRTCPGPAGEIDVPQQRCPLDPFSIVAEKCRCVDQQTLKLQESPEMVPVGELPRQVLLTVDRCLVNKVSPGTRLTINGIYSIFQGTSTNKNVKAVAIRTPFIRVVGYQLDSETVSSHSNASRDRNVTFTENDEREMIAFSRQADLYERFSRSIAPSIFGNDDIKKAICCLLFGGSRKMLPDRIRLRGDINVLLLGDPGVAKSQFLKFVEKVSPISVYTSGKGSSAAGLTASVVRDPSSGEFYLEGGAMVLADGGVVCIDEFDKMDNEDRVAIHEAMEQQTISIAKAGITTILNSRTSVLAAANPVFGRYDELKTPGENIDFSTTILSRFDMIFVLRDEHNAQRDMTLARHVLSVHMNAHSMDQGASEFDLAVMKKFISYCKSHCAPRLSGDAADKLSNHYVSIRSQVHRMEQNMTERSSIPITIRQLEAIVRIAESLAKMTLSPVATEAHIDEALRMFRVSTMQAVISGHSLEGMARPDLLKDVDRVEKAIRQRLPIGSSVSYRNLVTEMSSTRHFPEHAVVRAIDVMVQQEKLLFRSQRKVLIRQR